MKMVISHTYVPNKKTICGLEQLLYGVLGVFTNDGTMQNAIDQAMDKFNVPEDEREFGMNIFGRDSKVIYLNEDNVYTDVYEDAKYVIEIIIMEIEPDVIMG